MVRRLFNIIAASSAFLFLVFLVLWVLKVRVEWGVGEPPWFAVAVTHGDTTPELMIGLRPLFIIDISIVFPMGLLLLLSALWSIWFFVRRRAGTRGFVPVVPPLRADQPLEQTSQEK